MIVLLGLVTAHFVADFVLQSGFREYRQGGSLIFHMAIVAGLTGIMLAGLVHWSILQIPVSHMVIGSVAAGVVHAGLDATGAFWQNRLARRISGAAWLAVDQMLHLAVLLGLGNLYLMSTPANSAAIAAATGAALGATAPGLQVPVILQTLLLATLATGFAAVLIARLLEPFQERLNQKDTGASNAGVWIGVCERILLVLAIAAGSEVFPAVGLVLTAKSIFRFRELENRAHAEYYLLGTLLSITVAVTVGLALRSVYPVQVLQRLR